jgi:sulfatase modifying factor 1
MNARVLVCLTFLAVVLSAKEPIRIWTSKNGITREAEYLDSSAEEVTIRMRGVEHTLPLAMFSKADKEYVEEVSGRAAQVDSLPLRTWTSPDGRTIQAEYLGSSEKELTIRMIGVEHTLPLSLFSKSDQEYVKEAYGRALFNIPIPFEDEGIGLVIVASVKGKVEVLIPTEDNDSDVELSSRAVIVGESLSAGATLITAGGASANLLLTNGTLVQLGGNTKLVLTALYQKSFLGGEQKASELVEEVSPSRTAVDLQEGDLVMEVRKLDKESSFLISTKLAHAGIRGTQFKMSASADWVELSVLEGRVDFLDAEKKITLVESGKKAGTRKGVPAKLEDISDSERAEIKESVNQSRQTAVSIDLNRLASSVDQFTSGTKMGVPSKLEGNSPIKKVDVRQPSKDKEQAPADPDLNRSSIKIDPPVSMPNYLANSALNMELIWCQAGRFIMGPGQERDSPVHEVILTKGFYLSKYEVTQEEYQRVMGKNPSKFRGTKNPVEQVSWNDVMAFCKALTKSEGKQGWEFTLPTEAQWEYACRAGTRTAYSWGSQSNPNLANFEKSALKKTAKVGSYKPNQWGFYDMHGNVMEWCLDYYGPYSKSLTVNPLGPNNGKSRVYRGGSWRNGEASLRSGNRNSSSPVGKANLIGFRVALVEVN